MRKGLYIVLMVVAYWFRRASSMSQGFCNGLVIATCSSQGYDMSFIYVALAQV